MTDHDKLARLIEGARWTAQNAAGMTLSADEVLALCRMDDEMTDLRARVAELEREAALQALQDAGREFDRDTRDRAVIRAALDMAADELRGCNRGLDPADMADDILAIDPDAVLEDMKEKGE